MAKRLTTFERVGNGIAGGPHREDLWRSVETPHIHKADTDIRCKPPNTKKSDRATKHAIITVARTPDVPTALYILHDAPLFPRKHVTRAD